MLTRWAQTLDREHPLPEYPRPQLVREGWLCLNGPWDYAITEKAAAPEAYDGVITVPFSPEAPLSGVDRTLSPNEYLHYRRKVMLPEGLMKGRLLLHFGAVDQSCEVFVNGMRAGAHEGGYNAFTFDITSMRSGTLDIAVAVRDDTDASYHSRGKQKTKRGGIWYTPQSGIWQTVWLEAVPEDFIGSLTIVPDVKGERCLITAVSDARLPVTVTLEDGRAFSGISCEAIAIPMKGAELWSPESPRLYDISVAMGEDCVKSYFAMRSVSTGHDEGGIPRLMLNGKPYFMNGLLDQGYWPDGLYTAPSDEAFVYDIETMKSMGFNMLRKHIKVEPMRWYYHCDRLGMIVWQDMINGGRDYSALTVSAPLVTGIHISDDRYRRFARQDEAGRDEYYRELKEMVCQLISCPCIALWTVFNEGWGQFDALTATDTVKKLDPTRLVDHASGWHDQGGGDMKSLHVYFRPYRFKPDRKGRPVCLTEFGGYTLPVDGHRFNESVFGYKPMKDADCLKAALAALYDEQIRPAVKMGLAAAVYTQVSDVEDELNGLLTYDRLPKLDGARFDVTL